MRPIVGKLESKAGQSERFFAFSGITHVTMQAALSRESVNRGARALFDDYFYRRQAKDLSASADAFEHYRCSGWRKGFDPHPLFSTRNYCYQRPWLIETGDNPLVDYVARGDAEGVDPHPLFDSEYYRRYADVRGTTALEHYLSGGHLRHSPHPLFDRDFYVAQLEVPLPPNVSPLSHFVRHGWSLNCNPHPLFNLAYYFDQRDDVAQAGVNPLEHYIQFGAEEGVRPHPLFDTNYYFMQTGQPAEGRQLNPLLEFLESGSWSISPHRLFDIEFYIKQLEVRQLPIPNVHPLLHYLRSGHKDDLNPHPMFDTRFYRINFPYLKQTNCDPLTHYLAAGHQGIPVDNPKYDTAWGYWMGRNPHPLFDNDWYKANYPESRQCGVSPLEHHLRSLSTDNPTNPCWAFDTAKYFAERPACLKARVPPAYHFYAYQQTPYEVPGETLDSPSVDYEKLLNRINHRVGLERGLNPVRIIITSHDASRTGAPMIILNLARRLKLQFDIEVFTILERGGELELEFGKLGPKFLCERVLMENGITNLSLIVNAIKRNGRTIALCNSAETAFLARLFTSLDIPCISLLHEFTDSYTERNMGSLFEAVKDVVFPSQLCKDAAIEQHGEHAPVVRSAKVIPQGLFEPRFLSGDKDESKRRVCAELGISEDTFLVLGCGIVQPRKGCDLFILTAQEFFRKYPKRKAAFVWIGKFTEFDQSFGISVRSDLKNSRLDGKVFFLDDRPDPYEYFWAADCLAMVSRKDPFPCVVIEAMAAKTPVVMFDTVIGSREIVRDDAGAVVPFLDIAALAQQIGRLDADPELRARMGQVAHTRVRDELNFDDYATRILDVCCNVLGTNRIGTYVSAPVKRSSNRPRIYFSAMDWTLSGVNTVFERLVTELGVRGWDAQLLFTKKQVINSSFTIPSCPHATLPLLGRDMIQDRWEALQSFLIENSPCVLVQGYDFVANGITPALPDNVATLLYMQSDDIDYYEQAYRLGPYSNRILAVSDTIRKKLLNYNGSLAPAIHTVHNSSVRASSIVHRTTVPSRGPIRLVYAGRLVENQKRILDFVPLVRELDKENIPFQLTLIGNDCGTGARKVLEAELSSSISNGAVTILDRMPVDDVCRFFVDTDIFVLLSDFEGFPLSLVEAMAAGCVPLTTPIESGVSELIQHGVNGFQFERGDWSGAVEYIRRLRSQPSQRLQMSRAATDTVLANYTIEHVVEKFDVIAHDALREVSDGNFRRLPTLTAYSAALDILPPPSLFAPARVR